jgi:chemotaxis protein CheC
MTGTSEYSPDELDALREVANIGAGAAATELYRVTGEGVDIAVPNSRVLRLDQVLDAYGSPELEITAIGVEVSGDLDMLIALLVRPRDVARLEGTSTVETTRLDEVGERMCSAFAYAIGDLTGFRLGVHVGGVVTDLLGAVVQSLVAPNAADRSRVLFVDLDLGLERSHVDVQLLCVPRAGSVARLLQRLGVGDVDVPAPR